jgi:hypothetical protein
MFILRKNLFSITVSILIFVVIFYGCGKNLDLPTEVDDDPVVVFESYYE